MEECITVSTGKNSFALGGIISLLGRFTRKRLNGDGQLERKDDVGINLRVCVEPGYRPTDVQRDEVIALLEKMRRMLFSQLSIESIEYHAGEVVFVEHDRGPGYVGYVTRDSYEAAHIRRVDEHGNVQHMTLSPRMANFAVYKGLPYEGEKSMVYAAFQRWGSWREHDNAHFVQRFEAIVAAHRADQQFIRALTGLCKHVWLMHYVDDPVLAFELMTDPKDRNQTIISDDHRFILADKVDVEAIPELFRLRRLSYVKCAVKALRRLDQETIASLFRKYCAAGVIEGSFKGYEEALDPETAKMLYEEGLGVYPGNARINPWTDHDFRKALKARFTPATA